jgi:hypothetical protein
MAAYSPSVVGQVCCECGHPAICFVSNNNGSWLCASHFVASGPEVSALITVRRQSPAPVDAVRVGDVIRSNYDGSLGKVVEVDQHVVWANWPHGERLYLSHHEYTIESRHSPPPEVEPSERAREESDMVTGRNPGDMAKLVDGLALAFKLHEASEIVGEIVEERVELLKQVDRNLRMLWLVCDHPEKRWCFGDLLAALGEPPPGKEKQ